MRTIGTRDKSSILSLANICGSDEEVIALSKPVKATGNIEDWLGALEKGMQVRQMETQRPLFDHETCACGRCLGKQKPCISPLVLAFLGFS